jgi:hypothetical protein
MSTLSERILHVLLRSGIVVLLTGCGPSVSRLESDRDVSALMAVLESGDAKAREQAAEALGRVGDGRAVDALVAVLADEDAGYTIQETAVQALIDIGDPRAVEPLLRRFGREARSHDRRAFKRLVKFGRQAAEALVILLDDLDKKTSAREALILIGEPAVEPLINHLPHYRTFYGGDTATEILGLIGTESAVEPLVEARGHRAAGALDRILSERFTPLAAVCKGEPLAGGSHAAGSPERKRVVILNPDGSVSPFTYCMPIHWWWPSGGPEDIHLVLCLGAERWGQVDSAEYGPGGIPTQSVMRQRHGIEVELRYVDTGELIARDVVRGKSPRAFPKEMQFDLVDGKPVTPHIRGRTTNHKDLEAFLRIYLEPPDPGEFSREMLQFLPTPTRNYLEQEFGCRVVGPPR